MIDCHKRVHFGKNPILELVLSFSSVVLAVGCSVKTASNHEILAAEQALAQAEQNGIAEHLPTTMQRARAALTQAHALQEQQMIDASVAKATEASLLVDQAVLLDQRRKAWDLEIERFFEEQVSHQLMMMLLAELAHEMQGEVPPDARPSHADCTAATTIGF